MTRYKELSPWPFPPDDVGTGDTDVSTEDMIARVAVAAAEQVVFDGL